MQAPSPENAPQPDARVASLINEYFDRRQGGEDLTPDSFLAEHAEFAEALHPFLEGLAFLDRIRTAGTPANTRAAGDAEIPFPEIDGFEVLEEIGRGGMGVVYKARRLVEDRIVALKVMLAGPFASQAAHRRFEREVELASRLAHDGIVHVLESGRAAGQTYYAMEYVTGAPLDRYLAAAQPDVHAILKVFCEISDAVQHAHEQGVVHRDLKPGNILIDGEGRPHILDFGLAKVIADETQTAAIRSRISVTGDILGTLSYLSPEQAAGRVDRIDARTDVHAIGVILYEALTSVPPFGSHERPSEILRRILEDDPVRPCVLSDVVDTKLEAIILKALEKDRARRYQSAGALGEDIRSYLDAKPITARKHSGLSDLRKRIRRHIFGSTVCAIAIVVAAAVLIGRVSSAREAYRTARRQVLSLRQQMDGGEAHLRLASARLLLSENERLPEARLTYACAQLLAGGMHNDALLTLEQGMENESCRWPCAAFLAEIYRGSGNVELAERFAAEADRLMPDSPDAWYVRSFATIDFARAREYAERAVSGDPGHVLAWQRVAHLRYWTKDLLGACAAADEIIRILGDPTDETSHWARFKVSMLARQGRCSEAIGLLDENIAAGSGKVPDASLRSPLLMRGHVHRRLGMYQEALDDYEAAEHLAGGEVGALQWVYYQKGSVLWMLGRHDDAIEAYRQFGERHGGPFYADARLFLILREIGRTAEAESVLKTAREAVGEGSLSDVLACLAGEFPPENLVESAVTPKERCEACYYAGEACLLAGRTEAALARFRESLATGVEFDPAQVLLTPMNEYDLAEWRLKNLTAKEAHSPYSLPLETAEPQFAPES